MNDDVVCAVALAIRRSGDDALFGVLRPDDPADPLTGVWGLPAATIANSPSPSARTDAVVALAHRKLGMAITEVQEIASGSERRADGLLSMTLFEARSADEPALPDAASMGGTMTFYVGWRWMQPREFLPAADRGSLCTRLLLNTTRGATDGQSGTNRSTNVRSANEARFADE